MSVAFRRPPTLEAAFEELADDDALVFAGGQSLVVLMNAGLLEPQKLVSIAGISSLQGIEVQDGLLDLGALCTHDLLAKDPLIVDRIPAMARMFSGVGNIRVRTSGTLGGNLAHADPAQDPAVMLSALDAQVVVAGRDGERQVPVAELAIGPLVPAIDGGEIITRVRVPVPSSPDVRCSYIKFRPSTQDDYATVSIGARVTIDHEGRIAGAHLAAGSVGPTVVVLADAAARVIGCAVDDEEAMRSLHNACRDSVMPFPDRRGSADYKREMTGVIAVRAVRACAHDGRLSRDATT